MSVRNARKLQRLLLSSGMDMRKVTTMMTITMTWEDLLCEVWDEAGYDDDEYSDDSED